MNQERIQLYHLYYCRGQIGEDGEVFEKVCEPDCEGVHTNMHYTVHKDGVGCSENCIFHDRNYPECFFIPL